MGSQNLKRKYIEIDFEFNGTSEQNLNLVCCSLKLSDTGEIREYWLHNNENNINMLRYDLVNLDKEGYIFVAHGVSAEASSLYSMGLYSPDFKWICTFAEFRCLSNHNHEIQYGKHLVDGRVKTLYPPKPKYEQTEEDKKKPSGKITHSYGQMAFKFLGKTIDTSHKNEMRDIIISCDEEAIEANKEAIQAYCTSDLDYLLPSLRKMMGHYKKLLTREDYLKVVDDMLLRGNTMAHNAIMERNGYPIAFNNLRNFALQIPDILDSCSEDINGQFPDRNTFVYSKALRRYQKKEKHIREWIKEESGLADKWKLTSGGTSGIKKLSLSLDAFLNHFPYVHSYPRGNYGAQMVRFLKLKQSLNGFSPKTKGKKTFWDNVGRDRRVRSYLNPYGSLSGRYQPPSTGFLFLKPAWMRSLCVPPKGKMIVGIDYKSEEFLISGLFAKDLKMIEAYKSGDVYLAFAKDSGMVPQNATKASHPIERQSAKSAVLGISYLMTKYGLSTKMTQDLGEEVDEDDAQEYIDSFNETYDVHAEAVEDYLEDFSDRGYGRLSDGWTLFGDNENFRSVANFPKQGTGGAILRKAVQMAHDSGLKVVAPLHDALYFEVDVDDWAAVQKCCEVMRDAFIFPYLNTDMEEYAELIMLDVECWSKELTERKRAIGTNYGMQHISLETIHIDERASNEYDKFSKYFEAPEWSLL